MEKNITALIRRYEELQVEAEEMDLGPGDDVDYDDRVLALMGEMYHALKATNESQA